MRARDLGITQDVGLTLIYVSTSVDLADSRNDSVELIQPILYYRANKKPALLRAGLSPSLAWAYTETVNGCQAFRTQPRR